MVYLLASPTVSLSATLGKEEKYITKNEMSVVLFLTQIPVKIISRILKYKKVLQITLFGGFHKKDLISAQFQKVFTFRYATTLDKMAQYLIIKTR